MFLVLSCGTRARRRVIILIIFILVAEAAQAANKQTAKIRNNTPAK